MIDFTGISDDQLLQLLKAAMKEAITRGGAVRRAASDTVLDARERARIEQAAYERARTEYLDEERERIAGEARKKAERDIKEKRETEYAHEQERMWGRQKAIHVALQDWGLREGHKVTVWVRDGDRRVYLDGDRGWKVCLYVTGNSYHPPGDLEIPSGRNVPESERMKLVIKEKEGEPFLEVAQFLKEVAARWKSVSTQSQAALASPVKPSEKDLEAYRRALGVGGEVSESDTSVTGEFQEDATGATGVGTV